MNPIEEETLERFEAKLAAIDGELWPPPPLARRGRSTSGAPRGRSLTTVAIATATVAVLLVGVVAVGSLRSTQGPAVPTYPQATTAGPSAAAATQSAPASAYPSYPDGIPSEIDRERVYRS